MPWDNPQFCGPAEGWHLWSPSNQCEPLGCTRPSIHPDWGGVSACLPLRIRHGHLAIPGFSWRLDPFYILLSCPQSLLLASTTIFNGGPCPVDLIALGSASTSTSAHIGSWCRCWAILPASISQHSWLSTTQPAHNSVIWSAGSVSPSGSRHTSADTKSYWCLAWVSLLRK